MDRVIVTGGAGYVGSHICKVLRGSGFLPITVDNLITGNKEAVRFGPFAQADILDRAALDAVFTKWKPIAVIHMAALTSVEESVANPKTYWDSNVEGTRNVVEAMLRHNCLSLVFSSTCAVYGNAASGLVTEDSPASPESPYAESKLAAEALLTEFAKEGNIAPTFFRYFNVAGADPAQEIGEWKKSPSNLIPVALECAAGDRPEFEIFGTDYPTPDGTCIRDFVHVIDLADAHVRGLQATLGGDVGDMFNIGTGRGNSVREVIDCCHRVTGVEFTVRESSRRAGDVIRVVSDCAKAGRLLGWSPANSDLESMITDAWNWHRGGGFSLR
ncbi:MAG: UDP-glucose 4-epimerase GalE [Rhodobacteraceae bacterium]|nr:UDP-glucose 4-epimerase GalE [Paracoccaceae bacterium]